METEQVINTITGYKKREGIFKVRLHVFIFRNDGSERMPIPFNRLQKSLGRSEVQIQVQTHRQMILIVCYIERYHFFLLPLFVVLYQREHQTTIFHSILSLENLFSPINQRLFFYLYTRSHREKYPIAHFIRSWVERTGLQQDTEHIEHTMVECIFGKFRLTIFPPTGLVYNTFSVFVFEMDFVNRITTSFLGSLSEVHRFQTVGCDACQCITHLKEHIYRLVTYRIKGCLIARFPLIIHRKQVHSSFAGTHPNKFPVEF